MTGEEEEPEEQAAEELPEPEPQRERQPRSLRQPEEDRPVVVEARDATVAGSRPQPGMPACKGPPFLLGANQGAGCASSQL